LVRTFVQQRRWNSSHDQVMLRYVQGGVLAFISSESYTGSNRRTGGTLGAHHIAHIAALCGVFCKGLRNHLAPQRTSNGYLDDVIEEALTRRVNAAKEGLRKILEDEKCPPLTFNHYYTLTIQKARLSKRKQDSAENEDPNGTLNDKRAKTGTQTPQFGLPRSLLGFGGKTDGATASQVAILTRFQSPLRTRKEISCSRTGRVKLITE
jgi:hypothetical protein